MSIANIPDDRAGHSTMHPATPSPQEIIEKILQDKERVKKQQALIPMLGTWEDVMTLEELEDMRGR